MSNCCPDSALNQQLCSIRTFRMAKCSALRIASATASGIRSTAVTSQSGRSQASASAIAPVPVPKSRIRQVFTGNRANACSTRHSVSGRGISVAGETKSGSDQNSRKPVRYAIGSPCLRRCSRSASCCCWTSVSGVSPKAMIYVRPLPVTYSSRISASRRGLSLSRSWFTASCSQC